MSLCAAGIGRQLIPIFTLFQPPGERGEIVEERSLYVRVRLAFLERDFRDPRLALSSIDLSDLTAQKMGATSD